MVLYWPLLADISIAATFHPSELRFIKLSYDVLKLLLSVAFLIIATITNVLKCIIYGR